MQIQQTVKQGNLGKSLLPISKEATSRFFWNLKNMSGDKLLGVKSACRIT